MIENSGTNIFDQKLLVKKKSLCEFILLSSLQSQISIILGCQVRQDTTHRALRKASSTFVWMSVQYNVDFN